ncbi:MAG: hypothetical protein P9L92_09360 [Candidatus Electryonea clarkiae]|nr:hypothetical protein [Candidatus Electryonea clarkiae]MDP8288144.1 hypothetical protein [Candidatus Electryonea clarkiae]
MDIYQDVLQPELRHAEQEFIVAVVDQFTCFGVLSVILRLAPGIHRLH